MSFQSGSASFRAFRLLEDVPEGFRDRYTDQIGRWALVERQDARTKDPNCGWCYFANVADIEPGVLNKWLFNNYCVLGMRVDQKRVDGKQLKVRQDEKIREIMNERGIVRMGAAHRREVKEALEEDLLHRAIPSTKNYELVWDIHARRALVFTTQESMLTQLQNLFYETFELRLWPDRPYDWLVDCYGWEDAQVMCQPFSRNAPEPKPQTSVDPGSDPLAGMNQILTADFISWLWYRSVVDFGSFAVKDGPVDLWVDDKVSLANERGKLTIAGESAPTDEETVRGLATGKKPVEVRFGLRRGEAEWFFTLKAAGHGPEFKSVKLPAVVKEGAEEMVYERAFLIESLERIVHELWCHFFQVRIGDGWSVVENWLLTQETDGAESAQPETPSPSVRKPMTHTLSNGETISENDSLEELKGKLHRSNSMNEARAAAGRLNRMLAEDGTSGRITGPGGEVLLELPGAAAPAETLSDDDLDVPV